MEEIFQKELKNIIVDVYMEVRRTPAPMEEMVKAIMADKYLFDKTTVVAGTDRRTVLRFMLGFTSVRIIPELSAMLDKNLKKELKAGRNRSSEFNLSSDNGDVSKVEFLSDVRSVYNEISNKPPKSDKELITRVLHDNYGLRKLMVIMGMEIHEIKSQVKNAMKTNSVAPFFSQDIRKQINNNEITLDSIDLTKY